MGDFGGSWGYWGGGSWGIYGGSWGEGSWGIVDCQVAESNRPTIPQRGPLLVGGSP